ncbi:MAG: DUF1343 domain-containing protein [Elusimicrobiota bacterium]
MIRVFILIYVFSFSLYCEGVKSGLEVLEEENFDILKNKKIGVIVNHTSINSKGLNLVDIFIKNNINLIAIFSPEHGFKGDIEGGFSIDNSTYNLVPIYSLYGKTKKPTDEMLKDLDTLVFDIQDVGVRFYTYLTTMGYAMEEATKRDIEFIVLDRPNPISDVIEGPVLDKDIKAFTAYYEVPVRHSLTPCEMAYFHKLKSNLKINLKCVKMKNYNHKMFFNETNLPWVNPSPNIRNLNAAILYAGIGCFEATNISVGRGTEMPFEFFGSPWLDNESLVEYLNSKKLDGVEFYPVEKIPDSDLYKGEKVKGVYIKVLDKEKVRAMDIFVHSIYFIYRNHRDKLLIEEDGMKRMVNEKFLKWLYKGKEPQYILNKFQKGIKKYQKYLKKNNIVMY